MVTVPFLFTKIKTKTKVGKKTHKKLKLKKNWKKIELEKIHGTLKSRFYGSSSSAQIQRICFFLIKNKKNHNSSASDYWEYTKSYFKEHASKFSKNYKLRWYRAWDLFGSKIPVTTREFQSKITYIRSSYLPH